MDFENFFRKFFGTPNPFYRPEEDRNEKKDDQHAGNHDTYDNFHWKTEFQQMDLMMTQLMQEMLRGFPMLVEDKGFPTLDAPPYKSPPGQESPSHQGSLREQMLKPGKDELLDKHGRLNPSSHKLNSDFDEAIEKNNLQILLPQPQNDGLHYSFRSSSTNFTRHANGMSITKSTGKDGEGCQREMTAHEFNGKKYVIEKRFCPGAAEQLTETLVNLTKEELPEFLKHWQTPNKKD